MTATIFARKFLAATIALAMLTTTAMAGVRVIDGDTIAIDDVTIRLLGVDTPETFRSRCPNEHALGLAAKRRLGELLDAGPVTYVAQGKDRYQRTLATVHADGIDVGARLIEEKLALPSTPGAGLKARRLAAWCN